MIFKRNKKKNIIPQKRSEVLVSSYTPEEALMMHEALEFTLRECSHLNMKNKFEHGSLLTEEEVVALKKLSLFLVQEDLRYTAFILENGGNV